MSTRISRLRTFFSELKVDGVLVTKDTDIRYLTDFPAAESWLLVTQTKVFYITDFRYAQEAQKALKGIEVVQYEKSLFETTRDLLKAQKVKILGIDERHVTAFHMRRLRVVAGKVVRFKPVDHAVDVLRSMKDGDELALIRKAIQINLEGFRYIEKYIKPGVSEKELLYRLEDFIRNKGVGFAFPPIIASGPNAAFPHARVSERKVRRSEPLLIDLGIDLNGYKSDLTRMFFLGKMTHSFEKVLSLIRQSQEEAYKVIRPGVIAQEVDRAARGFLEKHGLAKYFGHSLGHGVGLDVHEDPRISQKSGAILAEGMVITVEPGVYFPQKYGVRQEDMVLVTKTGCEVLSDRNY